MPEKISANQIKEGGVTFSQSFGAESRRWESREKFDIQWSPDLGIVPSADVLVKVREFNKNTDVDGIKWRLPTNDELEEGYRTSSGFEQFSDYWSGSVESVSIWNYDSSPHIFGIGAESIYIEDPNAKKSGAHLRLIRYVSKKD